MGTRVLLSHKVGEISNLAGYIVPDDCAIFDEANKGRFQLGKFATATPDLQTAKGEIYLKR